MMSIKNKTKNKTKNINGISDNINDDIINNILNSNNDDTHNGYNDDSDTDNDLYNNVDDLKSNNYDTLVLSGGGIKGLMIMGTLFFIDNKFDSKLLSNIKYYCGTSVGSFICYLLILGLKPMDIFTYTCENVKNININVSQVNKKCGFIDIEEYLDHLKSITIEKTGKNSITFKEVTEYYGKEFVVCSFNLTKKKTEIFSSVLTPDMSCIDAIRLSSAIPFVFTKQYYKNNLYVDGALTNIFPINKVYYPYTTNPTPNTYDVGENILGICIKENGGELKDDNSLFDYGYFLIHSINELCQEYPDSFDKFGKAKIIKLENDDVRAIDFNMSTKQKIELFNCGYNEAKEILHKKKD